MQFDATTVDLTSNSFKKDWYECFIAETDERENSKGTGRLLEIQFQVRNGPCAGRSAKIWISYVHDNPTAQEIGSKALAKICQAVNIPNLTQEQALVGKVLSVQLAPDGEYITALDYRASANVADSLSFDNLESDNLDGMATPASENPAPQGAQQTPWAV